jgi:hypothetical protein
MSRRVPAAVKKRVRADFANRCAYCLAPQRLVFGWLVIEHIQPRAKGGRADESNLCLSCEMCNIFKATQVSAIDPITRRRVRLFNPRRQVWSSHFQWSRDGTEVVGKSATGRATVAALQMNNVIAVKVRLEWTKAGWHPPASTI